MQEKWIHIETYRYYFNYMGERELFVHCSKNLGQKVEKLRNHARQPYVGQKFEVHIH